MTSNEEIEETLDIIRKVWQKVPELRLCQLLSGAAKKDGWSNNDLFYLEDDKLRKALRNFMK